MLIFEAFAFFSMHHYFLRSLRCFAPCLPNQSHCTYNVRQLYSRASSNKLSLLSSIFWVTRDQIIPGSSLQRGPWRGGKRHWVQCCSPELSLSNILLMFFRKQINQAIKKILSKDNNQFYYDTWANTISCAHDINSIRPYLIHDYN